MKKYVIQRNQVYAGVLMMDMNAKCVVTDKNGKVMNDKEIKETGIELTSFSCGIICRGILFTIKDNASEDLIYTTPSSYSIEGINSSCLTPKGFEIKNMVCLEEILKYLGYGDELTQDELYEIYRNLVCSDRWLEKHMELFGWKKNKFGYSTGSIGRFSLDLYENLNRINCIRDGKPYECEPNFQLIKRKRV